LRALRQWLTARGTDAALALAPRLRAVDIARLQALVGGLGPRCPVLGHKVAENMRAAGVYTPELHRAYFRQIAAHLAGAMHAFRCAGRWESAEATEQFARLVREQIEVDPSLTVLRNPAAGGQGAVILGPHCAGYLLHMPRLNHVVPLTVLLRHSRRRRRAVAKARWCQVAALRGLAEPRVAGRPHQRLAAITAALRAGAVLFVTPDLPRSRDDGIAVPFLGREIYLPGGAAVAAVRTGVPVYFLWAEADGARHRLMLQPAPPPATRLHRHEQVEYYMRWFAGEFERFVRAQPAMWYSWGDKRWTRVLRGDADYSTPLASADRPAIAMPRIVEAS